MWLTRLAQRAGYLALAVTSGSLAMALGSSGSAAAPDEPRLTVLNPTGDAPPLERRAMAPRPPSLDGKTVYLVDVTFNGGDVFLQRMQAWMAEHLPKVKTVFRVKKGAYATDDPDLWKEIKSVDGLMIMAIGH
jgi:hypothetical protein